MAAWWQDPASTIADALASALGLVIGTATALSLATAGAIFSYLGAPGWLYYPDSLLFVVPWLPVAAFFLPLALPPWLWIPAYLLFGLGLFDAFYNEDRRLVDLALISVGLTAAGVLPVAGAAPIIYARLAAWSAAVCGVAGLPPALKWWLIRRLKASDRPKGEE